MADDHHQWLPGSEPPFIRAHSIANHRVIEQYLLRYVEILSPNPRIREFRFTLVDGFAGGGLYRDERTSEIRFGSPLLMLKAMRESEASARAKRTKDANDFGFDVDYFFVESSPAAFLCLEAAIKESEFRDLVPDKIRLMNDQFINRVEAIIDHIKQRGRGNRAIFVLDQLGYKDVPFSAIRSIMAQLENAEIILTFATDWLIDYLTGLEPMQKTLEKLGLAVTRDQIQTAKQHVEWRSAIQNLLHHEIHVNSGAKHYTPFFIRSTDAHRDYWLIHLSNHWRARDVMVDLHWRMNTCFAHFGGSGLPMLGYDQNYDIKLTGQPYLFDTDARAATHGCLLDQLPERLFEFKDGIAFGDFFGRLTNELPATSEIVNAALAVMLRDKSIAIMDKTGTTNRQAGIQHWSDVIKPSPQPLTLFLGK